MIRGQDAAVAAFLDAWHKGTPHHAWLLSGPKGVGKASFADLAARRVLAESMGPPPGTGLAVDETHPAVKLMEAGSHPDFRRLERMMNKTGTGLTRSITVEQVRALHSLFNVTPSLGDWRVVIIDSADDLEKGGANALLKMLEEPPPKTLFFLVSHAPGRLLPTIRSRCRVLQFQPLDHDVMTSVLGERLNDGPSEIARLSSLSDGSIGQALAIARLDLLDIAEQARTLMRQGDPGNDGRIRLAKALAKKADAERYAYFLDMVPGLVASEARSAVGERRTAALDAYAAVREEVAIAPRLSLDPQAVILRIGNRLAAIAAA